jgi:SAM-dependent methyltransferase
MNMWDERYREPGFAYGTEPNDFLRQQAPLWFKVGQAVLSLAEGEGRNAVWLAQQGLRVTGVDGSKVGLAKAQALAAERGVSIHTVCADLTDWDPGEAVWDGVVSIWAHLPSAPRRKLFGRVVRSLKPGGVLVLEHYHPRQLLLNSGGPKEADRLADLAALQDELKGLEWLVARELERQIHEGALHQGLSAVVQLVGKKPLS